MQVDTYIPENSYKPQKTKILWINMKIKDTLNDTHTRTIKN